MNKELGPIYPDWNIKGKTCLFNGKIACVQTLLAGLGKEKMSRARFAERVVFSLPKLYPQTREETLHTG